MKLLRELHITYDTSWDKVTLAVFNKYPNPFAKHVLSADIIDRYIGQDGKLRTTRLLVKKVSCVPILNLTAL